MSVFFENVFWGLVDLAKAFHTSVSFSVVKFLLEVFVIVIIVDLVLLLKQRGLGGDMRDTLVGMNIPPEFGNKKNKLRAKWAKVRNKFESKNESAHKVAIIEADKIIEDLIGRLGYKGGDMSERLDNIPLGQIENVEDLRRAHEIRNRIIHDESFVLSGAEAEKVFGYYEDFLRYFMVLD